MATVTYTNKDGSKTVVQQNSRGQELSRSTSGSSSSSGSSGSSSRSSGGGSSGGNSTAPSAPVKAVTPATRQAGESIEEYTVRTSAAPEQYFQGNKNQAQARVNELNKQAEQMQSNGGYSDNSQSARNGASYLSTPYGISSGSAGVVAKLEAQQKQDQIDAQAQASNPNLQQVKISQQDYQSGQVKTEAERLNNYGFSVEDSNRYARGNVAALNEGARRGMAINASDVAIAKTPEEAQYYSNAQKIAHASEQGGAVVDSQGRFIGAADKISNVGQLQQAGATVVNKPKEYFKYIDTTPVIPIEVDKNTILQVTEGKFKGFTGTQAEIDAHEKFYTDYEKEQGLNAYNKLSLPVKAIEHITTLGADEGIGYVGAVLKPVVNPIFRVIGAKEITQAPSDFVAQKMLRLEREYGTEKNTFSNRVWEMAGSPLGFIASAPVFGVGLKALGFGLGKGAILTAKGGALLVGKGGAVTKSAASLIESQAIKGLEAGVAGGFAIGTGIEAGTMLAYGHSAEATGTIGTFATGMVTAFKSPLNIRSAETPNANAKTSPFELAEAASTERINPLEAGTSKSDRIGLTKEKPIGIGKPSANMKSQDILNVLKNDSPVFEKPTLIPAPKSNARPARLSDTNVERASNIFQDATNTVKSKGGGSSKEVTSQNIDGTSSDLLTVKNLESTSNIKVDALSQKEPIVRGNGDVLEVPKETTKSKWTGLSLEVGYAPKREIPLIGIIETNVGGKITKSISLGTPNIPKSSFSEALVSKGGIESPTALENRILEKNVIEKWSPEEQQYHKDVMAEKKANFGVKSKFTAKELPIDEVFNRQNEMGVSFKKETVSNVKKWFEEQSFALKNTGFQMGGSTAQKAQSQSFREPKDFDFYIKNAGDKSKELLSLIEKTEGKGKVMFESEGKPTIVTKKGSTLFDIHDPQNPFLDDVLSSDISSRLSSHEDGSLAFGFSSEKPTKIGKTYATTLSEQETRLMRASNIARDNGFFPAAHRGKDPAGLLGARYNLAKSRGVLNKVFDKGANARGKRIDDFWINKMDALNSNAKFAGKGKTIKTGAEIKSDFFDALKMNRPDLLSRIKAEKPEVYQRNKLGETSKNSTPLNEDFILYSPKLKPIEVGITSLNVGRGVTSQKSNEIKSSMISNNNSLSNRINALRNNSRFTKSRSQISSQSNLHSISSFKSPYISKSPNLFSPQNSFKSSFAKSQSNYPRSTNKSPSPTSPSPLSPSPYNYPSVSTPSYPPSGSPSFEPNNEPIIKKIRTPIPIGGHGATINFGANNGFKTTQKTSTHRMMAAKELLSFNAIGRTPKQSKRKFKL